jgi:hypothetical protein
MVPSAALRLIVGPRSQMIASIQPERLAAGAPVVISPPDADVVGAPRAVSTDGRHIVATFVAATRGSFELLSVPSEAFAPDKNSELAAAK